MIENFLTTISESAIGIRIAEDPVLFPWIEVGHVLALTIVFGTILFVDLRLLGLAARDYPISRMSRAVVPVTWTAFILAVITGTLLFMSNPFTYFGNVYFKVKLAAILCAGVNMAIFHFWTMRSIGVWDDTKSIPLAVRFAGLISIALWVTIVVCGRWIGFTMSPF